MLFTILNFLLGRPLFVSRDGYLRDVGGTRGRVLQEQKFFHGARTMLRYLGRDHSVGVPVEVLFDEPVDRSRDHAARLRELYEEEFPDNHVLSYHEAAFRLISHAAPAVDAALINANPSWVIATTDSRIIDRTACPVVDLASEVLRTAYGISAVDLADWIEGER